MSSCHTTIDPSLVPFRYIPIFRYALGEFMFADFGEVFGKNQLSVAVHLLERRAGIVRELHVQQVAMPHAPVQRCRSASVSLSPTCR